MTGLFSSYVWQSALDSRREESTQKIRKNRRTLFESVKQGSGATRRSVHTGHCIRQMKMTAAVAVWHKLNNRFRFLFVLFVACGVLLSSLSCRLLEVFVKQVRRLLCRGPHRSLIQSMLHQPGGARERSWSPLRSRATLKLLPWWSVTREMAHFGPQAQGSPPLMGRARVSVTFSHRHSAIRQCRLSSIALVGRTRLAMDLSKC